MAKNVVVKPLGLVLRKAGLVSAQQIDLALQESSNLPKCNLGEILAIRGLINPQTANFFAETWPRILAGESLTFSELNRELKASNENIFQEGLVSVSQRQNSSSVTAMPPLGQFLRAAHLIDDQQIAFILQLQQTSSSKFGKIAVEQGFISQTTLEFFLEHLNLIKTGRVVAAYAEETALEIDRIETYLLNSKRCQPLQLLQKYQEIYDQGSLLATGDETEQELIASGLIVIEGNSLRLSKPEYRHIFTEEWLEMELAKLQPYNQIRFKLFDLNDKADIPYRVVNEINQWADHQPFLTQKLYQLVQDYPQPIAPGSEAQVVEKLAYENLIDNWQTGLAAKHFQSISDRLNNNEFCSSQALLQTYKKVWQLREVNADNSVAQRELLQMGLIKLRNGKISVSNLIYQAVLDRYWIQQQLAKPQLSNVHGADNHQIMLAPLPADGSGSANNVEHIKKSQPKKSFGRKLFSLISLAAVLATLLAIPLLFRALTNPQRPNEVIEQGDL